MLVTNVPVECLLDRGFAPVKDGGFAGLVFLICRAADDPEAHLSFFREWTSTHDLTGRYFGVITPKPDRWMLASGPHEGGWGEGVRNLEFVGEHDRLRARSAGDVWMTDAGSRIYSSPTMFDPQAAYEDAVTTVASKLQEFFGIPEALLPCAVIVGLQDRMAFVVQLGGHATLYRLLKLVKTAMEPMVTRINQKASELDDARSEWFRDEHRRIDIDSDRRRRQRDRDWQEHRMRLADELLENAGPHDGERSELCLWMASRLGSDAPLSLDEDAQAQRLLELLHGRFGTLSMRQRRSLGRDLRRTLHKLNSGYPQQNRILPAPLPEEPTEYQLHEARYRAYTSHEIVRARESELRDLHDALRIGPAVAVAAERLGLEPATSQDVLSWRRLSWPITAFVRQRRSGPALRFRRA